MGLHRGLLPKHDLAGLLAHELDAPILRDDECQALRLSLAETVGGPMTSTPAVSRFSLQLRGLRVEGAVHAIGRQGGGPQFHPEAHHLAVVRCSGWMLRVEARRFWKLQQGLRQRHSDGHGDLCAVWQWSPARRHCDA